MPVLQITTDKVLLCWLMFYETPNYFTTNEVRGKVKSNSTKTVEEKVVVTQVKVYGFLVMFVVAMIIAI